MHTFHALLVVGEYFSLDIFSNYGTACIDAVVCYAYVCDLVSGGGAKGRRETLPALGHGG